MMVDTAIKIQSHPAPKRPKLVRFKNFIKSEDSTESKSIQLELILDQWNDIVDQLESVQAHQEKKNAEDTASKRQLVETICEIQDLIHKSTDMVRLLHEDMGTPARKLQGMTLWEGI